MCLTLADFYETARRLHPSLLPFRAVLTGIVARELKCGLGVYVRPGKVDQLQDKQVEREALAQASVLKLLLQDGKVSSALTCICRKMPGLAQEAAAISFCLVQAHLGCCLPALLF